MNEPNVAPGGIGNGDIERVDSRTRLELYTSRLGTLDRTQHEAQQQPSFTLRATVAGILVGILVCFANAYFGLQTGFIAIMTLPAAVIGFSAFRMLEKKLASPFTAAENAVMVTIAGSLGTMPFTAGLVGVVPALEFLTTPEQNGPLRLNLWQLGVWSVGISILGVVVALPLRNYFLIEEQLRFPFGTSAATLIGLLHKDSKIAERVEKANRDSNKSSSSDYDGQAISPNNGDGLGDFDAQWHQNNVYIIGSFIFSAIYTMFSYFVPVIRKFPIFGLYLAREWLLAINSSPAYVSIGLMIMPITTLYMVIGATIGWAILSPIAKSKGWASGPTGDWETGSRGWIVWVAIGLIIGDAIVGITVLVYRSLYATFRSQSLSAALSHWKSTLDSWLEKLKTLVKHPRAFYHGDGGFTQGENERTSLIRNEQLPPQSPSRRDSVRDDSGSKDSWSGGMLALWMVIAAALCFSAMYILFGSSVPPLALILAVVLVLPLSLISIRAYGETGAGGTESISKLPQFLFALIIPRSNPNAILVNLAVAGVVEAGTWQSAELMDELKIGLLVRAPVKSMFYGQLVGSTIGALVASMVYRLYTTVYTIPSEAFPVPTAHVWMASAKLVYGAGLPKGVWPFAVAATTISATSSIIRIAGGNKKWTRWFPPGIAVAVGIYLPPDVTFAQAVGGSIRYYSMHRLGVKELPLVCLASGFILGEGVFSLVNVFLSSIDVPHL